jgi:exodeoxyribonuclease VII small subunit
MSHAPEIETLTFEQALAELEQIVARLESGQAPLDASIELYERGAKLKAHCEARLADARLRVEKIVQGLGGGAPGVEAAEFN